jgi:hypothetical protein
MPPETPISRNTKKATEALRDLKAAIRVGDFQAELAAAQALESAACQLRRAYKRAEANR